MDYQKHFFGLQIADFADTSVGELHLHRGGHGEICSLATPKRPKQRLAWPKACLFFLSVGLMKRTTSPHEPYPYTLKENSHFSKW